jgi:hypothetical protein
MQQGSTGNKKQSPSFSQFSVKPLQASKYNRAAIRKHRIILNFIRAKDVE